jgi:hypothetical protein
VEGLEVVWRAYGEVEFILEHGNNYTEEIMVRIRRNQYKYTEEIMVRM